MKPQLRSVIYSGFSNLSPARKPLILITIQATYYRRAPLSRMYVDSIPLQNHTHLLVAVPSLDDSIQHPERKKHERTETINNVSEVWSVD